MKRVISFCLVMVAVMMLIVPVAGASAVAGKIYSTDILAYVDGMPVPSYNIGGKTVVSAEGLRDYGFAVTWNADDRNLTVSTRRLPDTAPVSSVKRGSVGRVVGNVYKTDISVFVNGLLFPAYNIGGETMLALEDLGALTTDGIFNANRAIGYSVTGFKAVWNAKERTISLLTIRPGSTVNVAGAGYEILEINSGVHPAPAVLTRINGDKTLETVDVQAGMLRDAYYPVSLLSSVYGGAIRLDDGKLYVSVAEDMPQLALDAALTDDFIAAHAGWYCLSWSASNAITPISVPFVKVPLCVEYGGQADFTELHAYIYDGEILVDVSALLAAMDK